MTNVDASALIQAKAEADKALADHELRCEKRYADIRTSLVKTEALMQRNTKLLWVVIAGLLAVAGKTVWLGFFDA